MSTEVLKVLVIVLLAPLWIPFLKALWEELNLALREEGGVLGPKPGPLGRERIRREIAREEDPLVNEPIAHARPGRPRGS